MASLPMKTFSVSEVAKIIGCDAGTVRYYCRKGAIPADVVEIPGTQMTLYMLPESSVERLRETITPRQKVS